jgi:methylenetetrahydrofolate reductase (NADPH)
MAKKVDAGAQFIQTQAIYDIEKFGRWMEKVRSAGLDQQAYMLAGIVVNKSLKSIEMTALVAGMDVPQHLIERMRAAEKRDEEGIAIAVELIQQIRKIKGVSGIHIMAIGWEKKVPEILAAAGM